MLVLYVNLQRVAVISEVDHAVTFIYGMDCINCAYFVIMEIYDFKFEKMSEIYFIWDLSDVIVRKVKFDEVDAFAQELEMFIEQIIACQDQNFKFLWSYDFAIE